MLFRVIRSFRLGTNPSPSEAAIYLSAVRLRELAPVADPEITAGPDALKVSVTVTVNARDAAEATCLASVLGGGVFKGPRADTITATPV